MESDLGGAGNCNQRHLLIQWNVNLQKRLVKVIKFRYIWSKKYNDNGNENNNGNYNDNNDNDGDNWLADKCWLMLT